MNLSNIKGGVHAAVVHLLNGFQDMNIQVRVVSLNQEIDKEVLVPYNQNIEIAFCPIGPYKYSSVNYLLHSSTVLRKHITEFNPDIIHYQIGGTLLFSKLRGLKHRKHLITIHGLASAEAKVEKRMKKKIALYYNSIIGFLLLPRRVIHISEYSKKIVNLNGNSQQAVIYNAVSPHFFDLPVKQKTNNKLLYVGVINTRKNLLLLLEAMQELRTARKAYKLDIIGDFEEGDTYREDIKKFIDENNLGSDLTFHGWKSQEELSGLLKDADILVLPSKQETLPMSIAEAMAAGKVVVSTKVGGIPEMISTGIDGFLFNVDNKKELVQILDVAYNNDEQMSLVANQARQTATEKYHCRSIAQKTLDFYKKIA